VREGASGPGGAGGSQRSSLHIVDVECDSAVWDAGSTFTLPPPDSSSERPSDTGSTFSLPLNQYPPREEGRCSHCPISYFSNDHSYLLPDLDAAPAPEGASLLFCVSHVLSESYTSAVPSISEASVGTKPVDGSGSRWRRMRTLVRFVVVNFQAHLLNPYHSFAGGCNDVSKVTNGINHSWTMDWIVYIA
jgi:hypothetical protein